MVQPTLTSINPELLLVGTIEIINKIAISTLNPYLQEKAYSGGFQKKTTPGSGNFFRFTAAYLGDDKLVGIGKPFAHFAEDILRTDAHLAVVTGGQVEQQVHDALVGSSSIQPLSSSPLLLTESVMTLSLDSNDRKHGEISNM